MADVSYINVNGTTYNIDDRQATEDIGNLAQLSTTDKSSLVGAINELYGDLGAYEESNAEDIQALYGQDETMSTAIGTLANLTTTEKTNLVGAVNELDAGKAEAVAVAAAFSTSSAYAKGQYCLYNGDLYVFTADKAAGSWDASKVEQTSVGGELGKINKYDDLLKVIKITDATTTMGDITATLATVNSVGDHVVFDVAALGAGMYLCTIYIGSGYYRIADLVTGFEGTGFFSASDLLVDIIKSGSKSTGKHYTVQWDKTNAACVRLNDAAAITTNTANFGYFGSVNADYDNPFDSIYPWSGRKLCNIDIDLYRALTSANDITDCVVAWEGDVNFSYEHQYGVWVYTPPFFGRSYELGNYRYFDVTDENLQDNIAYPAMITGRWLGVAVTLTIDGASKSCNLPTVGMPMANIAVSTQHTYAKNYGGSLADIYVLDASVLLFVVEYATLNTQTAIGNGVSGLYKQSMHLSAAVTNSNTVEIATDANIIVGAIFDIGSSDGGYNVARTYVTAVNGTTVTLADAVTATTEDYVSIHGLINVADEDIGSKSGYIGTNGKCNAYYRGECLYGNKYQYILGAYRQKDTNKIFSCDRDTTDNYDALNTSVHHDTGLALPSGAEGAAVSGYIGALGMADGLSIPPFATAVGGNATNPVGDYVYVPTLNTANTILLLGGYSVSGPAAGAFYGYWHSSASSSIWDYGSRPRFKNPA